MSCHVTKVGNHSDLFIERRRAETSIAAWGALAAAAVLCIVGAAGGSAGPGHDRAGAPAPRTTSAAFRGGVADRDALGPGRSTDALLQLTSGGHVFGFAPGAFHVTNATYALRVEFEGAHPIAPQGDAPADTAGSPQVAPLLGRVTYANLWDGITLTYEAVDGGLARSTYRLKPGADPSAIRLRYSVPARVNTDGSLTLEYPTGRMSESAPVAWQEVDGRRVPVTVAFTPVEEGGPAAGSVIGFALGGYDPARVLVIDPTLTWNTFLGSSSRDVALGVAVDGSGNVYVAGWSFATWGAPVRAHGGLYDAFVAKLDASGSLLWHTFLGGSGSDFGHNVTVDEGGNVYVTGYSHVSWGAPVRAHSGGYDAFAAKLSPSGALAWHTFLSGGVTDHQYPDIAVDGSGNVYVAGKSLASFGTPVRAHSGSGDAFAAKLDTSGALVWNTFLGGGGWDDGFAIALDGSGSVYVLGVSAATWGAPVRPHAGGSEDAFVAKLDASGVLVWNTFLGASGGFDNPHDIAMGAGGSVYVGGESSVSWGTPVRAHTGNGGSDVFVAKLDGGGGLAWNTFLGGSGGDTGSSIAVDGNGDAYITGYSTETWGAPLWPFTPPLFDAFVAKLDTGGGLTWHAFFGGTGMEYSYAIAVDGDGDLYVAGESNVSWGAPVRPFTVGSFFYEGDGFVAKIQVCGDGSQDPGEQCDEGAANGAATSCCAAGCAFRAENSVCRPSAGPCDVADTCTGTSGPCPADQFAPVTTLCRGAAGVCDLPEFCLGTGTTCPADAKSTAVCRVAANDCDLAESCDGSNGTCPPDLVVGTGTPCDDEDACTVGDACRDGQCADHVPVDCTNSEIPPDPCTSNTCNPVAGCTFIPIPNCNPADSTEAVVGGPGMLCTGGALDAGTNTCVLSTPSVELRIPLDGPSYALPEAQTVTVAALANTVNCSSSFSIGAIYGPGSVYTASCVELYPTGQCFAAGSGVTLAFKWAQDAGPGCTVAGTPDIPEGSLRVFDEAFMAATAECGSQSSNLLCPSESALSFSGCGGSSGASCPGPLEAFCSGGTCRAGGTPGLFEVYDVRHFSRHGLGVLCFEVGSRKVKITKLDKPPGEQMLSFSGYLSRWAMTAPDPAANGVSVRLYDTAGVILDALVPPGAAWTSNGAGNKWTYRSDTTSGITKVVIKDLSSKQPGYTKFKVKGRGLALAPASAYVEGQILFPTDGDCYRAAFPGAPLPACRRRGPTLQCK